MSRNLTLLEPSTTYPYLTQTDTETTTAGLLTASLQTGLGVPIAHLNVTVATASYALNASVNTSGFVTTSSYLIDSSSWNNAIANLSSSLKGTYFYPLLELGPTAAVSSSNNWRFYPSQSGELYVQYWNGSQWISDTKFTSTPYSGSGSLIPIDLSAYLSSSWTGSTTSQFSGTASFATQALSASYAPATATDVSTYLSSSWTSSVYQINSASFSSSISSLSNTTASYITTSSFSSFTASISLTASYISGAILNTPDPYTSTAPVFNIVTLTSAEYTALAVKDANTFYAVV